MNSFWRGKMGGIACALSLTMGLLALGNQPVTPLPAWKLAYFTQTQIEAGLAEDQFAPGGDGIPNLYKYALGVSPWENIALSGPTVGLKDNRICIQYRKVVGATDISYRAEISSDLLKWMPVSSGTTVVNEESSQFVVVEESDLFEPPGGRRFIRLSIERTNSDVDSDGMADDWEIKYGLDPMRDDSVQDADGDGVSNLDEHLLGTDPAEANVSTEPEIPMLLSDRVNFERSEGYSIGQVDGQNGWRVRWGSGANVDLSPHEPSESQLLAVESGSAVQRQITPLSEPVIFVQFDAELVSGSDAWNAAHFIVGHTRVFAIRSEASAELWVGTHGSWYDEYLHMQIGVSVPVDPVNGLTGWHRFTMRIDRGSGERLPSWDLYVDGRLVAYDLHYTTEIHPFLSASDVEVLKVDNRSGLVARVDRYLITTSNPVFEDGDSDGMPDQYEIAYGHDLEMDDRRADADDDSLTNFMEYVLGTHPLKNDTDGDRLADIWEVRNNYNPAIWTNALLDEDEDGLDLLAEQAAGSDPRESDSDGDFLSDGQEITLGSSPARGGY